MRELRYTLVSDGSSDRALIPILNWLLRQYATGCVIQPEWADLRRLPRPIRNLTERIRTSLDLYPCDLLFVHRDAENISYERRVNEIERVLRAVSEWARGRTIGVVPVRMTEAGLLVDETTLRRAAGNPNGQQPLALPSFGQLEQLPDPKNVLDELLKTASGLRGRRLKNFEVRPRVSRLAEFIRLITTSLDDDVRVPLDQVQSRLHEYSPGVVRRKGRRYNAE